MKAIVVYESLWGNTAAILQLARQMIAREGFGAVLADGGLSGEGLHGCIRAAAHSQSNAPFFQR